MPLCGKSFITVSGATKKTTVLQFFSQNVTFGATPADCMEVSIAAKPFDPRTTYLHIMYPQTLVWVWAQKLQDFFGRSIVPGRKFGRFSLFWGFTSAQVHPAKICTQTWLKAS